MWKSEAETEKTGPELQVWKYRAMDGKATGLVEITQEVT